MAKKKSTKLNLANIVCALVALLAVVLFIFLPMVKSTLGEEGNQIITIYKGFGMIFGGTVEANVKTTITIGNSVSNSNDVATIKDVAFNTMAFLSVLLVVLGAALTFVVTFVKQVKGNKLFTLAAGALLVIGGILMFTVKGSSLTALDAVKSAKYFSLAVGPILAGILSILAGAGIIVYPSLKK